MKNRFKIALTYTFILLVIPFRFIYAQHLFQVEQGFNVKFSTQKPLEINPSSNVCFFENYQVSENYYYDISNYDLKFIETWNTFNYYKSISVLDSENIIKRNFIGFLPSKANYINGIALGIVGSEVYCDYKISKISNGLNIQIGQGLLLSRMLLYDMNYLYNKNQNYTDSLLKSIDTSYYKAKHNGLLLSLFGSATDKINGVSVSGFLSVHKIVNGISISLFGLDQYKLNGISISTINKCISTNGLQIGIYNNSVNVNGLQIGFWNRNTNRSLPILNW